LQRQQQPKQGEVGDEKVVDDRDEPRARQFRHQRAIERLRDEQGHECGGEHPRQVTHSARDGHLIAQRAQYVISRKQHEKISKRPQRRAALLRRSRHGAGYPALQAFACAGLLARCLDSHCGNDSFCFSSAALTCCP
jgi:hypothetical protein